MILQDNMTFADSSVETSPKETLKYTCLECNYKTKVKSEMNAHVQSSHTTIEKDEIKFICGECSQEFIKEEDFKKHVKMHQKLQHEQTTSKLLVDNPDRNIIPVNLEEHLYYRSID